MTAVARSGGRASAAAIVANLGYVAGGAGAVLATTAHGDPVDAVRWIALLSVGAVGVLAFIRHVIFAKEDATRIGWTAEGGSNFQYETGFANLAMGLVAIIAVWADWGGATYVTAVLAYGLYLLQAGIIHLWNWTRKDSHTHFLRSVAASLIFSGILLYYALRAMSELNLAPF
ncbi:MAG: DUF6790 family protein [Dehalococcoidia bacterium]